MSGILALASSIASMDRDALERLVRLRRPSHHVADPIALATDLLRPDSILRAACGLHRSTLDTLATGGIELETGSTQDPEPVQLGFVGLENDERVPLPEVVETVRQVLTERASEDASNPAISTAVHAVSASDADDISAWYAIAATGVGEIAEFLRSMRTHPGRVNLNGTVAIATVRGLTELLHIPLERAAIVIRLLESAGFTLHDGQRLRPSPLGEGWLAKPLGERWTDIARTVVESMPKQLRTELASADPATVDLTAVLAAIPADYPLLPEAARTAICASEAESEFIGLSVEGRFSPPAIALLFGGDAERIASDAMPDAVSGVYLQPDLSVVVPGPLDPADEDALGALTAPEHIGVASTRRVTVLSLTTAFEGGITAAEARSTFERLSITGIPQPLDYMLDSHSARVRSILVSADDGGDARTHLEVTRPELVEMLLVDRSLNHLQLQRAEGGLKSRLRPEHVAAALSDARYPASFAPPSVGAPEEAGDEGDAGDDAAGVESTVAAITERVFTAAQQSPGVMTRHLQLAIRDHFVVRITAESRGQQRTFTMMPIALNSGRLRAIDQEADVERTFPVEIITEVETV